MNPSFSARLAVGSILEQRVKNELETRRWTVDPWGQGTLSEPIRAALQRSDSRLRFLPDLIAARDGEPVTIDCKDRMRSTDTGRYAIKKESVNFGLQLAALGVPMFYVFGNLGVLVPGEVASYGRMGPRATGGGAYYLVGEHLARRFDDVFGTASAVSVA